jgi:ATPase subunit of ABC transporter with duplicated ATPase domains
MEITMIQVENLSFGFPTKDLYKDVSFTIEAGQHCAFIGSNGTGKTTLIDMICDSIGRCFIIADKTQNIYVYDTDLELQNTIPNKALIISAMTHNNGILTLLSKDNMSYVNTKTTEIRRCNICRNTKQKIFRVCRSIISI